ncbi:MULTISPECIES: DNA alkylation repair protein [Bacillus cereus group]|uniref:DNA alkylation repair protein n=1 Tax=Bacillus cereus group TaxID=86661 RepID=UPI000BEE033D|nr:MULTISPECIES: DNA alkylation repair protein [Bacillus cereus group]MBJ8073827.1 DNA alkylation repair protein [Bacillus cereus group sp. N12]MBJ8097125.1 DNA alkylation repair protein [Bacillus cereus group sp. N11]PDY86581.1 DNA alkylation repair protein [Bacillus toyonensis]PGE62190.1 DNA alkylation repair protein [Bacillus toyonensis]PHD38191.1 DNA alkylation repair protein [Bacillus toyonensis]
MITKESEVILNRKGARKVNEIPKEVLQLLQQGKVESVNLTEWLAINHIELLKNVLPLIGLKNSLESIVAELEKQNVETGMKVIRITGTLLDEIILKENEGNKEDVLLKLSNHISDSVRCWAAFMNKKSNNTLKDTLTYIRPFAADHHFGVREIAWMSIREDLSQNIEKSVELLVEWAKSEDENIRRFSVESIRPRGVWSKHIEILKQEPEKALPILNLLKSDPSKYVQDSVGNWLNDASKTKPDWVMDLCEEWEKDTDIKSTSRIIKKAKRTILKNK